MPWAPCKGCRIMDEIDQPNARPASADEFRAFLDEIGETQSGFAQSLKRMGDDRQKGTILRHVQRMALGEARISGEMRVIMSILRSARSRRP